MQAGRSKPLSPGGLERPSRHSTRRSLSRVTGDVGTVAGSGLGLLPSLVIRLFQFSACLILILWYDPDGPCWPCSAPR